MPPLLTYTETSLPGPETGRREQARRHQLALEIEDWGGTDAKKYRDSRSIVATVQVCRLKKDSPTAPGRRERRRALEHIEEGLELADRLGTRRALTICAYGEETADAPFERALDLFDRAGRRARALGVQILIEPLSTKRSPIFHDPSEVVRLLEILDEPDSFGLALDTGHLLDGEYDPLTVLGAIEHHVTELQLRGPNGTPPDLADPLGDWLDALANPPEVLCVEHREEIEPSHFDELLEILRPLVER